MSKFLYTWPTFGQCDPVIESDWKCSKCGQPVKNSKICVCGEQEPPPQDWSFTGGARITSELNSFDQPWPMSAMESEWVCTKCEKRVKSGQICPGCNAQQISELRWFAAAESEEGFSSYSDTLGEQGSDDLKLHCPENQLDRVDLQKRGYV